MEQAAAIQADRMKVRFQLPPLARPAASGTSRDEVPFAVYSVPALPAANLEPKVSAHMDGNSEKISPQQAKVMAAKNMKPRGSRPQNTSPIRAAASPPKTISIRFSRPKRSDRKPMRGRVAPLQMLSMDMAMVNSGMVTPSRVTGILSRP